MAVADKRGYDPLLECLAIFARLYHQPVSIEALVAGLPVEPGAPGPELFSLESSKGLFSRVANRAGFATRLIRRDLDKLSELLLPCILVLEHRNACIIESIDRSRRRAKIIIPDVDDGEEWIDLDRLDERYLGFAFLLKPEYKRKTRQPRLIDTGNGHWFWRTLNRSRELYASVLLGSVMINLFALVTPLFTMNVYDRVVPNHAVETLWVLAVGVSTVYVLDAMLKFLRNHLLEVAGKKSDVIMSSLLFEQVMNLRMDRWPDSVGAFSSKLNQFESIRNFFTAATLVTVVDLPFSLVFIAFIAYIGDALVTVPLIVMALLLLYGLVLVRPLRSSIQHVFSASSHKNAMLVETLHSIQTIKTLGVTGHAQWGWEESTGEIAARAQRTRTISGSVGVVTNVLVQLNMVGIVVLGVYEIIELRLSLGALIAVVILSQRAIAPMAQIAGLVTNYQQTKTAYESLNKLMTEPVERPEGRDFVRRPEFKGSVGFRDVTFAYPGGDKPAVAGLTFKIEPGEHVGIIGRSGSGKTTVAKLLMGLYAPSGGSLTVDDLEISQIDPADLRRNIGYLSQDIHLVRGSLRDNVALKDPRIEDEAILAAAHVGGVDLFVSSLAQGFDTRVGEQGEGFSGGQRQCIALARTALLNEPIVVLDEPTNSMDNLTESAVRERLLEYTRDKTLILVTHKSSMLDLVDRLIVIEDGRVAADGPKAQVLEFLKERSKAAA